MVTEDRICVFLFSGLSIAICWIFLRYFYRLPRHSFNKIAASIVFLAGEGAIMFFQLSIAVKQRPPDVWTFILGLAASFLGLVAFIPLMRKYDPARIKANQDEADRRLLKSSNAAPPVTREQFAAQVDRYDVFYNDFRKTKQPIYRNAWALTLISGVALQAYAVYEKHRNPQSTSLNGSFWYLVLTGLFFGGLYLAHRQAKKISQHDVRCPICNEEIGASKHKQVLMDGRCPNCHARIFQA